jgi:RNA polymerase-binding transcription factor DksA
MSEQKKNTITFYASPLFWETLHKHDLHERRRILRELIVCWDGTMREVPDEWRGRQELSLQADAVLQQWAQQLKEKGLIRSNAVFSAALQTGMAPPRKQAVPERVDEKTPSRTQGARPDSPKSTAKKPQPQTPKMNKPRAQEVRRDDESRAADASSDEVTQLYKLHETPYPPPQARQLLQAVLAIRAQAIAALRERGAWVMDFSRGDEADVAMSRQEREDHERALARAQRTLIEADAALARLREGAYGWCEETGEAIAFERMQANPLARFSAEAQEKWEKIDRLRGLVA